MGGLEVDWGALDLVVLEVAGESSEVEELETSAGDDEGGKDDVDEVGIASEEGIVGEEEKEKVEEVGITSSERVVE